MKKNIKLIVPSLVFILILFAFYKLDEKDLFNNLKFANQGFRINALIKTDEAFNKTNTYLLYYLENSNDKGERVEEYNPVELFGDDMGIYFFVVAVKNSLNISTIPNAYLLLFSLFIISGFFVATIGFSLLFDDKLSKIYSYSLYCLLSLFCFFVMNVYILSFFIISFIPLIIYFLKKADSSKSKLFLLILFFIGVFIGISNKFRSNSGTGLLLFFILYVLFYNKNNFSIKYKIICLLFITMPIYIPSIYFNHLINKRNNWLIEHKYENKINLVNNKHVLWHSLYLGMGFGNNKYGITCHDTTGFNVAKKINKKLEIDFYKYPKEYEDIMKNVCLKIIINDKIFFLKTLFQKFIYVLMFIFISFNLGIYYFFKTKSSFKTILIFLITFGFYIIPGVLVYPFPMYYIGGISIVVIANILLFEKYIKSIRII
ncbi:MAG: hypothetical protein WC223_00935 [Bacteroidales bacterium]|jgi:hypothetical protein